MRLKTLKSPNAPDARNQQSSFTPAPIMLSCHVVVVGLVFVAALLHHLTASAALPSSVPSLPRGASWIGGLRGTYLHTPLVWQAAKLGFALEATNGTLSCYSLITGAAVWHLAYTCVGCSAPVLVPSLDDDDTLTTPRVLVWHGHVAIRNNNHVFQVRMFGADPLNGTLLWSVVLPGSGNVTLATASTTTPPPPVGYSAPVSYRGRLALVAVAWTNWLQSPLYPGLPPQPLPLCVSLWHALTGALFSDGTNTCTFVTSNLYTSNQTTLYQQAPGATFALLPIVCSKPDSQTGLSTVWLANGADMESFLLDPIYGWVWSGRWRAWPNQWGRDFGLRYHNTLHQLVTWDPRVQQSNGMNVQWYPLGSDGTLSRIYYPVASSSCALSVDDRTLAALNGPKPIGAWGYVCGGVDRDTLNVMQRVPAEATFSTYYNPSPPTVIRPVPWSAFAAKTFGITSFRVSGGWMCTVPWTSDGNDASFVIMACWATTGAAEARLWWLRHDQVVQLDVPDNMWQVATRDVLAFRRVQGRTWMDATQQTLHVVWHASQNVEFGMWSWKVPSNGGGSDHTLIIVTVFLVCSVAGSVLCAYLTVNRGSQRREHATAPTEPLVSRATASDDNTPISVDTHAHEERSDT